MKKLSKTASEPLFKKYQNHPAYNNHPVCNISKEAAEAYCRWLTEQYNKTKKENSMEVIFRIPTAEEWMTFSSPLPGHRLPWYGSFPYQADQKGEFDQALANVKVLDYRSQKFNYSFDGALYTYKIGSYPSINLELHDIIGNVAELTSDNKIKGGSWDNTLPECYIDLDQNYHLPDPRVGFRVIKEVLNP